MGTSRSIHLGPFVRIPTQYETTETKKPICVDKHRVYNGDKFCPECGKPIQEITVPKSRALNRWDFFDNEKLFVYHEGEATYFLPNIFLDSHVDTEENKFAIIDHTRIIEMLKEFSETFQDEIAVLEAKVGQKLTVEFGFVYRVD